MGFGKNSPSTIMYDAKMDLRPTHKKYFQIIIRALAYIESLFP